MKNVRIHRTYNIDLELAELLDREVKKSDIINSLLREYFKEALKNAQSVVSKD